jgi:hypothetical protein
MLVAVPHPCRGQVSQPHSQFDLRVALRAVALRRPVEPCRVAGPPFTDGVGALKMAHYVPAQSGPQH